MKRAMERHESGEARVVPIILRESNWKGAPFAKIQALPKDGQPVMAYDRRDVAWNEISQALEMIVRVSLPENPQITFDAERLKEKKKAGERSIKAGVDKKEYRIDELLNAISERGERFGRGIDFRHAHIEKLVMQDDRSIRDVRTDKMQIAGQGSIQNIAVELPAPSPTEMNINLDAIRTIIKTLGLKPDDNRYIEQQLDNVEESMQEDMPDKDDIDKALDRTTQRLERIGGLAGAIGKLAPYASAIGQWVGSL